MELRHLRYFCAVADDRSFTAASQQLHVSQSGISGQIRLLEEEIGTILLNRQHREVTLTAAGAIFLAEAREILARSERAVEMANRAARGEYGELKIGLCGPVTAPFLPRLIKQYRKRQPEVLLSVKDLSPAQQPEALASGLIDIGFTRGIQPDLRRQLRSEVLAREPLIALLPSEHRLSGCKELRLSQLASENFILFDRRAHRRCLTPSSLSVNGPDSARESPQRRASGNPF
jgi:DNA-binding transcriptional LysR family regulator